MAATPRRHTSAINCTLLVFLLAGCSTPATIDSWKQSIDDYIWQEANGDPNALRNTPLNPSDKGFAIFSHKSPDQSTDVNGLLLAHRDIQGQRHFIFLVGRLNARSVEDIRLAALSSTAGQLQWTISPHAAQPLHAYRQYKQNLWRKANPRQSDPPDWVYSFPAEDDVFDLSISNNTITATHRQSDAQWTISVPSTVAVAPPRAAANE